MDLEPDIYWGDLVTDFGTWASVPGVLGASVALILGSSAELLENSFTSKPQRYSRFHFKLHILRLALLYFILYFYFLFLTVKIGY